VYALVDGDVGEPIEEVVWPRGDTGVEVLLTRSFSPRINGRMVIVQDFCNLWHLIK
jgi:hypothetical protein